jgi:hypothetical protein
MISTFLIALVIAGNTINVSPELPVSYKMEVRLDTLSHKLNGAEHIIFLNPTQEPLNKICFHLYPNAFKDTSSVFAHEDKRIEQNIASGNISHLDVSNIVIDGNAIDSAAITESGTLLYIILPASLAPRAQIDISLDFELLIPRVKVRLGYDEWGNYILAHWHPILCGYQRERLIDTEYHANSEFFSNFSNYDITINIPSNFEIGSTGELSLVGKDSSGANLWHAVADTVIDFAFACGPSFHVFESDTLGVKIRYLIDPDHLSLFENADRITKYSLAYNSAKLFPYPYKTFTVVDLNSGATGMELPQMIVIEFLQPRIGNIAKAHMDFVISHEITHEWFYAMVATNEAEEPWLDEGVTSYVTSRLLTDNNVNLDKVDIFGYKVSIDEIERLLCIMSKAEYPINLKSWEYPDPISYNTAVYYRTTLVMQTLEGMLGRAKFDSALSFYANHFRFRHPIWEDIVNVMVVHGGQDLTTFFYDYIAGTARVDYSIKSLEYNTLQNKSSIVTNSGEQATRLQKDNYKINVVLNRELDGILPQRLIVRLESGSNLDTTWNGEARVKSFDFMASSRPVYATIDSGYNYTLDENLGNNSLYVKPLGSRLLSFEWDILFIKELFLSFLL